MKENVFQWDVALMVINPDSLYYSGYFKGHMSFPSNYPYSPPSNLPIINCLPSRAPNKTSEFKFNRPLLHPNIYKDGNLCISILHAPGDDEMSGETAAERWTPAQRVESVLLSIISLLDDAECSSPANVDAGVMLRKDPEKYKRMVKADVEASKADIPAGFVMPTHQSTTSRVEKPDDTDFWYDSENDDDFGGSDTDADDMLEDDEDLCDDLESGADEDDDQEMEDVENALEDDESSGDDVEVE